MEKDRKHTTNFTDAEDLMSINRQDALEGSASDIPDTADPDFDNAENLPQISYKSRTLWKDEPIWNAKTEMLKLLDEICSEHNIQYFAFANLLISCVHYQDFLPDGGNREWEVGLLREDYEKLIAILREYHFRPGMRFTDCYKSKTPRKFALLEAVTEIEHEDIYASRAFHIRLIPFDRLPQSYDTRISFLEKMNKLNETYDKISEWHSFKPSRHRFYQYMFFHFYYGKRSMTKQKARIMKAAQEYDQDKTAPYVARVVMQPSKMIELDQLFPLKRLPFRDITVPCPNDHTVWTPTIDEALEYQVTSIQKADLILIQKLDEICQKLKIGYFVCGGTMLGYMRHGGFIPWDDDVDVAMLRADYDRFLKEAAPLLDDRFFLQTRESDPTIPYLFSKLRLNNTEYITAYNEHRDFHKGICLDIFPFDYIPNAPEEQENFKNRVLKLSAKHNLIANSQIPEPEDEPAPRNLKEKWYHWKQKTMRWYYHQRSLAKSQANYLAEATKYNALAEKQGLTTVASFVPSYTWIRIDDLLPYQDAEFNGVHVMVPKRPDVFLTMQYGDYMELPPKHLQVAHRLVRWSTDLSKADGTVPEDHETGSRPEPAKQP